MTHLALNLLDKLCYKLRDHVCDWENNSMPDRFQSSYADPISTLRWRMK